MRGIYSKYIIACILWMIFCHQVFANDNLPVRYLGIENGLSNNGVNSILQDHNGFMWFGTYDGLNRYDGYGFTTFRNIIGDTTSISSNIINVLEEDVNHQLWIGGRKEVNIYHTVTGKFSIPTYHFNNGITKNALNDNVISIKVISGMKVLVGTQHNGLFIFNDARKGTQIALPVNGKKIINYYVSAIDFDKRKNVAYVFVQNYGLFSYNLINHSFLLLSDELKNANCLKLTANGKLWLGNNNGLYSYTVSTHSFSSSVVSYKGPIVNLCEDKKGTLWIASDGDGIWLLSKNENIAVPLQTGDKNERSAISSNAVYSIYEDKEERKWIGTLRGGINIIEPKIVPFKKIVYKQENGGNSVNNFIFSFCEGASGNVWIGTDGAGLRYWDRHTNSYLNFLHNDQIATSISSNFITSMVSDARNNLWVATWFGGINRFNPTSKTFEHYTCYNERTKTYDKNIWRLFEDSKKRLWACAVRYGALYLFNQNTHQFQTFDTTLTELQCLAEDKSGNIWGGDYSSLIRIDTKNKQHKFYKLGYTVRCIYVDKNNNLWVGTQEGGLWFMNIATGKLKRYSTSDGLPNNTVLSILEDKDGNLWMSTYNGLSKFNPQNNSFRNFYQADGLQSNQFSFNAALSLSSGELLFGGIKGFNLFHPDSIKNKKRIPEIFLSGLKINNTSIKDNPTFIKDKTSDRVTKIEVPFHQATLSLEFLGLDYAYAADINYAYKLSGWDQHWNYVQHNRNANYSRLQEGEYFFEVKASNTEGVWSNPQQLLYVTVLPPWYRTWWAYSLYVLICIGSVYLYSTYKRRQAKLKYQIQWAEMQMQKEKEMAEKKIDFFTNISHEFRTPLSLIINPIKDLLNKAEGHHQVAAELKVVHRNARRLLRLADQLLLFKKSEASEKLNLVQVNFHLLCKEVFLCFKEQAKSKKIRYEFHGNVQNLIVSLDKEKIEIALFNILSNAFKYTPNEGVVIFKVEESSEQIEIKVSDTGPGIPEKDRQKIFERFGQLKSVDSKSGFGIGLYLVKSFVNLHKGSVSFISEVGQGTTFQMLLPKILKIEKDTHTVANNNKIAPAPSSAKNIVSKQPLKVENISDDDFKMNKTEDSGLLEEMSEDEFSEGSIQKEPGIPTELASDKQTLLIIDDDNDMRNYLESTFNLKYKVYQAKDGQEGVQLAKEQLPDLIITDIVMKGMNGIELCKAIKNDTVLSHIPIILLTASSSDEMQLTGINSGADDYIKKPFDKEILMARVKSLLKRRTILQSYFYNEITLGSGKFKVSTEYKEFIENCMRVVEDHLQDDDFSIKVLANELGMSHSKLYRKIKTVSGQSINSFIRFIRLKKAAEIFINTELNVNETATIVGINNIKYFRTKFFELFRLNPSEYIKKFRKPFSNNQHLNENIRK